MSKVNISTNTRYSNLIKDIGRILARGRYQAYAAVNGILIRTYWEIGREIVEFEQKGVGRAEYGSDLLNQIAQDLRLHHGKGFSRSNVYTMRQLYLKYPKIQTLSGKLSWSHLIELIGVGSDRARGFYEKQCLIENWSVRELSRQINSMLFERLALSKDKKAVIQLSRSGHVIKKDEDVIKEPYVLEFLKIPQSSAYSERELEQRIIDNLQMFLLELGKGFTFVGRQYRLSFRNKHYYVDLVFYHRILKCFVLVDLKIGNADHLDVGQMNMYLNYFKKEEMTADDRDPIGIILAADKDGVLVEYALGGISSKLFVSRYQLYLPDKKQIRAELRKMI